VFVCVCMRVCACACACARAHTLCMLCLSSCVLRRYVCVSVGLFCRYIGLFCRNVVLLCRNIQLFCRYAGLFVSLYVCLSFSVRVSLFLSACAIACVCVRASVRLHIYRTYLAVKETLSTCVSISDQWAANIYTHIYTHAGDTYIHTCTLYSVYMC